MAKTFDAVDMKQQAQDRVREQIRGMTKEEELAYWQEQSRRLAESRSGKDQKRPA
jgi:hypothetical protein